MSTKNKTKLKDHSEEASKAFSEHVAELRSRVFWIVVTFIVFSAAAYGFRKPLIDIILSPLGSEQLVYLTPGGGFSFIFKVTMYAGAVVAAPLFVFHLYKFIKPALPPKARRYSFRMLLSSLLLMVAGVTFGYFVAIPSALHFLTTFAGDFVSPNLTAESYLGFVMAYLVGLGILFQLPLLLIIWNWIRPIPPGGLWNSQRFVIAFSFIAAAIITPTPDLVNQTMVALPIVGIYQIGVTAVYIGNRRARKRTTSKNEVIDVVSQDVKPEEGRLAPVPSAELQSTNHSQPALAFDIVAHRKPAIGTKLNELKPVATPSEVVCTAEPAVKSSVSTAKVMEGMGAMEGMVRSTKRMPQPIKVPSRKHDVRSSTQVVRRRQISTPTAVNGCVPSLVSPSSRAVGLDGFVIH